LAPADRTSLTVSGGGGPPVPLGPANLAVRAAVALSRATGRRGKGAGGVRIEIRKRIPVAAGLAGGSADAAAALVACNELWRTGLSTQELAEIGARVGSDVPFALTGGTAVGIGRGERLTTALVSGSYQWVLAFGANGLSTPDVYAACDRLRAARRSKDGKPLVVPDPGLNTDLMAALRSGDPAAVGPLLTNDLQPAALSLQPLLRQALQAGKEHGALGAIVSGSGPTCAFLAKNAEAARELAVGVTGAGVCRAVVQVSGPAPGASVVESGALA
jgi:4-diphosphocytidyl-2-C-methyl-D-erythritol kinase